MTVFHTKTIESILDPVAQQVSRLVISHEEAEDGAAMPDLERPVLVVSNAVKNLVKIGHETVETTQDSILRQDLPVSLQRVDEASTCLECSVSLLKADPHSSAGRKKIIEGSRGILQGTSSLLLCLDEFEVRRIVVDCKRVLEYLAICEVITSMEDLVHFVEGISPNLTKMCREVSKREKELTHQTHRDLLIQGLEQVKTLAPILICAMKIFVQISSEPGNAEISRGGECCQNEAIENRDYLSARITQEVIEILRVLQLTTFDEDEWHSDVVSNMRRINASMSAKMQSVLDWANNVQNYSAKLGHKSAHQIVDMARKLSEHAFPEDAEPLYKYADQVEAIVNEMKDLKNNGEVDTDRYRSLACRLEAALSDMAELSQVAISRVDTQRATSVQPHTLGERLERAATWLRCDAPQSDLDDDVSKRCIDDICQMCDDARVLVSECPDTEQHARVCALAEQIQTLCRQAVTRDGRLRVASSLWSKLADMSGYMQDLLGKRIVEDFADILQCLKEFKNATMVDMVTDNSVRDFQTKKDHLQSFNARLVETARLAATVGNVKNRKVAEQLYLTTQQAENVCPQLINAGCIRLKYPSSAPANDNFLNLYGQYETSVVRLRDLSDDVIPAAMFVQQSEKSIDEHRMLCEDAIHNEIVSDIVSENTIMARLANRVKMVAKKEADNSEDKQFTDQLNSVIHNVENSIPIMIQRAKSLAQQHTNQNTISQWRASMNHLQNSVREVSKAISTDEDILNAFANHKIADEVPQRPPPPPIGNAEESNISDLSSVFKSTEMTNKPIMAAAHVLHDEVDQWCSTDNELVRAAKTMAELMAKLSQLVRNDSRGGSKRELISCARSIAEASVDVTRLAKQVARACTDKRMRIQLLQICERIPTIGTQLRILSTVKATMLGSQDIEGTKEDLEATEMLVGNAQNLMQSVKDTVRAAESASIKIRTESGLTIRWIRRSPWYY